MLAFISLVWHIVLALLAGYGLAAWLDERRARKEARAPESQPCTCPIPRETQEQLIRRGGVIHPQGRQVH